MNSTVKAVIATAGVVGTLGIGGVLVTQKHVVTKNPTAQSRQILVRVQPSLIGEARAAVVSGGVVVGVVIVPPNWPNVPNAWKPPEGAEAVLSNEAIVGDLYDGKEFYRPVTEQVITATTTP